MDQGRERDVTKSTTQTLQDFFIGLHRPCLTSFHTCPVIP